MTNIKSVLLSHGDGNWKRNFVLVNIRNTEKNNTSSRGRRSLYSAVI